MQGVLVIVQARMTSSRLPGKVMMTIGGLPLVELAARRAGNTGLPVCVATSVHEADGIVFRHISNFGGKCVRGSLDDVRSRFLLAAQDLQDSDIVVRLTADNVFPDGAFVEELVDNLEQSDSDYLGSCSPVDGLPYGLSAEAFRIGALRGQTAADLGSDDREHVTPSLRAGSDGRVFRPSSAEGDKSALRCTVDCLDDYVRVASLFRHDEDPVAVRWQELVLRLAEASGSQRVPMSARKTCALTLGTAQLGLDSYGWVNEAGQPSSGDASMLLDEAIASGVSTIDTARAYGSAEARIGLVIKNYGDRVVPITKLDPLADLQDSASETEWESAVESSVLRSCRELGVRCLPVLLLHRWHHRTAGNGVVWRTLTRLMSEGVVAQLGASVSTPDEAISALKDPEIRHLQLPLNILDHRWRDRSFLAAVEQRLDVQIRVRSVFLQGILCSDPGRWPAIDGVDPRSIMNTIDELVAELGRLDRKDLCIAYVRSHSWVASLVVGMETPAQFRENCKLFARPTLSDEERARVEQAFPRFTEALLNPAFWPQK